jgi:glycosyltransferase involved in cell wall biosynthesis
MTFVEPTPKVSICIPTYKAPEFFRRVIESVIVQDYPDFEIIVTDDSPDSCIKDILAGIDIPVPLRYEKNLQQLGAPGNWNRAIELATGTYIKILHHDDWLLTPHSLTQFVELMQQHPQAGLGFSAAEAYDQGHCLKFVHTPQQNRITDLTRDCNTLFLGNLIGPPSSIIFRNSSGIRFDEKLRWLVDVDFYIRLLQGGNGFAYCQQPLVGVTVESEHQVTRECENNKQVELYEHLYLFSKLLHKGRKISAYIRLFSQLFKRFSISSSRELALLAPDVKIPWYLKLLAAVSR